MFDSLKAASLRYVKALAAAAGVAAVGITAQLSGQDFGNPYVNLGALTLAGLLATALAPANAPKA